MQGSWIQRLIWNLLSRAGVDMLSVNQSERPKWGQVESHACGLALLSCEASVNPDLVSTQNNEFTWRKISLHYISILSKLYFLKTFAHCTNCFKWHQLKSASFGLLPWTRACARVWHLNFCPLHSRLPAVNLPQLRPGESISSHSQWNSKLFSTLRLES